MDQKTMGKIIGLAFCGKLPRLEGNKPDLPQIAQMFKITTKQAEQALAMANGAILR